MKKYIFPILYYLLLIAATAYVVWDVFGAKEDNGDDPIVIIKITNTPLPGTNTPIPTGGSGETTVTPKPTENAGENTTTPNPTGTTAPTTEPKATATPVITPTSTPTASPEGSQVIYTLNDQDINIEIIKYRYSYTETINGKTINGSTTVYVSDIDIPNISYLKITEHEKNDKVYYKTPETWIEMVNPLVAINGDMYRSSSGYLIRNGKYYPSYGKAKVDAGLVREDLVLFADGSHKFIVEDEVSAQELVQQGAYHVLSFGPVLIDDGKVVYSRENCISDKRNLAPQNPRTAIGQKADGHYVFIVVDGRNSGVDDGVTYNGLVEIGKQVGCVWLYNLDGGQSSQLMFNGKVQNQPYNHGYSERKLTEIVYIGR